MLFPIFSLSLPSEENNSFSCQYLSKEPETVSREQRNKIKLEVGKIEYKRFIHKTEAVHVHPVYQMP